MGERNLDFTTVYDRNGTRCLKYDFKKERGLPEDVLPFWVADMDFKISSYIEDALINQAKHGIYGYTEVDNEYADSVVRWIKRHYNRDVEKEWFHKAPGVVFAIATAVKAFSEKDDYILINQPVYYPFSEVIRDNGRKIISSDLVNDGNGFYTIDFHDLEEKIQKYRPKLYLLCSPHNPVGRVWDKEELQKLGEICRKNDVIVFSDEIHADFVWGKEFTTFANAGEGFENFSITALSPSKTFNIAGLQVADLIIANHDLYRKYHKAYDASGMSQLNAAGIVASFAAYEHGEEWLKEVKKVIEANIDYATLYVRENLPKVKLRKPEGTYLIWLDFRDYAFSNDELENLIINKAKLWLDSGRIFGKTGEGFQRINVACPQSLLKEALDRIKNALEEI